MVTLVRPEYALGTKYIFKPVNDQLPEGLSELTNPHVATKNSLLYRVIKIEGEVVEQLLISKAYISRVLYLAHSHLLCAHLGTEKIYKRMLRRFFWPGVKGAVKDYCRR